MFKTNPENINIPAGAYATGLGPAVLTDNLAHQLQAVVWDVVSQDTRTGVAPVPIPAASWLFASGVAAIAAIGKKKRSL